MTDDAVLAGAGFVRAARRVLAAGGDRLALHLRGEATSAARLAVLADALRGSARAAGALLLANDRVDLALVAELDGVHLKERSLSPAVARGLLPQGSRIGVSAHEPEGAGAAAADADYLMVGTVFATPSHPDRAGSGPAGVARFRAAVGLPLIAIGGVTPERVPELLAVGAYGVAVLRGIWSAPDPAAAVAGYLEVL